jgi:hypothetical protein
MLELHPELSVACSKNGSVVGQESFLGLSRLPQLSMLSKGNRN